MAHSQQPTRGDPNAGIPDLVRRLGDDSKRLVHDELRLAKLELAENARRAGRGVSWLAAAFGLGVVALVAFNVFLSTLIGRALNGHMWVGAVVTGVLELALAVPLLKAGLATLREPSYTMEETRRAAAETARWFRRGR